MTDDDGLTDSHAENVAVYPEPTRPIAGFAVGCSDLICGFIDESSDHDGTGPIVGWSWDFGDGGSSSAQHRIIPTARQARTR